MTYNGQNANYCSSVNYALVTAWAATAAKTVGQTVRQLTTPAVGNERIWMCTTAGTTSGTEPTWGTGRGSQITDGTVHWTECTGLPALNGDSASTPNWNTGAKSTNVQLGHIISDVAGTHYFMSTVSGNAGTGAEPTWNTSALGNTTTDSGVTWTYIGLVSAFTAAWANPHARLNTATNISWMANTATVPQAIYVSHDHAEASSGVSFNNHGAITPNSGTPFAIICVNKAGSLPPVTADLRTTATVTATTSSNMTAGNGAYRFCYGINFVSGNSSNVVILFNGDQSDKYYENCSFTIASSAGTSAAIQFNSHGVAKFKGCTFSFTNAGHSLSASSGWAEFDNCIFNGTAPSSFLTFETFGNYVFRNCDFSAWTGMTVHNGGNGTGTFLAQFRDCKLPSGFSTGDAIQNGVTTVSEQVILSRCNVAGANNPWQYQQNDPNATLSADNVVARTNGAQDAGIAISWKAVTKPTCTGANCSDLRPPLMAEWNSVTGSNVTVTVFGIINGAALPTNDACFIDVDYLGSSGTLGVRKSSRVGDYLPTTVPAAVTADTSNWAVGTLLARVNSHSYTVGDTISLASNPGRVFFCTATGIAASSEPGGYLTAIDGGSVTDGAATFRAGMRFKMTVTLTSPQPQVAGNVYCQIKFSTPSVTVYFDPLLSLS
jgi:hypothetical protein